MAHSQERLGRHRDQTSVPRRLTKIGAGRGDKRRRPTTGIRVQPHLAEQNKVNQNDCQ